MAKILKDTFTLSTLQKRLRAIRSYLLHRFFSNQEEKTDNLKSIDLTVNDLQWIYSLGGDFSSEITKDNVYQKLAALEEEAKKLPTLTLYLAFEPNDEAIRLIGQFLRNQFSHTIIYEFKIDLGLIAGAAIVWKGIYKDYSVKNLISQKQDEVLASFKPFLRKEHA